MGSPSLVESGRNVALPERSSKNRRVHGAVASACCVGDLILLASSNAGNWGREHDYGTRHEVGAWVAEGSLMTRIEILGPGDAATLSDVEDHVFDHPVRRELVAEFLADPRHHLAVAVEAQGVVGFASAVHYVHPDKPPELWINEVGVAPAHRKKGLAKKLLGALFERGRELGCGEAWVLTERTNHAAARLYSSLGGLESCDETVMFSFRLGESGGR